MSTIRSMLALAKEGRCNDAVPVFQLILQNIAADQTAFYNANEGIAYCQEQLGTPQPLNSGNP